MTVDAAAAVTPPLAGFSAKKGQAEKFSAKQRQFSANGKGKRNKVVALAENLSGLEIYVDDATLYGLIAAGKVGVHKNGGRQRKGGRVYDYRQRWRVLRRNDGGREVLAFGTPEQLAEKLAQLGVFLCFAHRRPALTAGLSCRQCKDRGVSAAASI